MNQIKSEDSPEYIPSEGVTQAEDSVIREAITILEGRLRKANTTVYDSPDAVKKYLYMRIAKEKSEKFCIMFLDTRHRMIAFEEMFSGTIDGASVYAREVVRAVIEKNAAAVILAHNHPSGDPDPSNADRRITERLVEALKLIDVRVLDHVVVGSTVGECVSFAERGLI